MSEVTIKELDQLIEVIIAKRAAIEGIEDTLTKANKDLFHFEQKASAYLKELNRKSYDSPHGSISLIERISFTVPKTPEDRQAFFQYLREEGVFEQLITVNHQTLNSYAKNFYEAAKERGDLFAKIPGLSQPTVTEHLRPREKKK